MFTHTRIVAMRHTHSGSKGPNQTYGKESVDTARHLQTTAEDVEQNIITSGITVSDGWLMVAHNNSI